MMKVNGFQVAPAEMEAVLPGHPAVLDCAVFGAPRRTGRRGAGGRRAARSATPVAEGELEALVANSPGHVQAPALSRRGRRDPSAPSGKVLRRTLRDAWSPLLAGRRRHLMDVRLSPEQQALQDAAARLVDRSAPGRGRPR